MNDRYAVFYAPSVEHPLWRLGSLWLGRDASTGARRVQPAVPGIPPEDMRECTRTARRYGFHATLKPPMRLSPGADPASLRDALEVFARTHPPVTLGRLEVRAIGGFLALMPAAQGPDLTRLAADCVREFEIFRAPPNPEEMQKRRSADLTARQIELLGAYGYPYVMEEFRFHMTLSDRLERGPRDILKAAATEWFEPVGHEPLVMDRICLFREPEPGAPFERLGDFPLAGTAIEEDVA